MNKSLRTLRVALPDSPFAVSWRALQSLVHTGTRKSCGVDSIPCSSLSAMLCETGCFQTTTHLRKFTYDIRSYPEHASESARKTRESAPGWRVKFHPASPDRSLTWTAVCSSVFLMSSLAGGSVVCLSPSSSALMLFGEIYHTYRSESLVGIAV